MGGAPSDHAAAAGGVDVELRPIGPDELDEFLAVGESAFGLRPAPGHVDEERTVVEHDRTIGAFVGAELIGTASAYSFELTLPTPRCGGPAPSVPVAGVTAVGVRSTHRRRGVLTAMMVRQLGDVAARGEPAAVLLASESSIYHRFGYGVASEHESLRLRTDRAAQRVGPPPRHLALVPQDRALELLAPVHEEVRRVRPGTVSRSSAWWGCVLSDVASWKGPGRCWVVVARQRPDGPPVGYCLYGVRHTGPIGDWTVVVHELAAVDPGTEAALWHHLAEIDLTSTVEAASRPVDEVLRSRLVEPRRLEVTARSDGLWVRPVDVAALLSARGYASPGQLVLTVLDGFGASAASHAGGPCPFDATGTYVLEVDATGTGTCRALGGGTEGPGADLVCSVADLGAVSLGGVTWSHLAAAGRVVERRAGSLAIADALFATGLAPFCSTRF